MREEHPLRRRWTLTPYGIDKPEKKGVETCGKNICVSASPTPEAGDGIDGGTTEEFKCGGSMLVPSRIRKGKARTSEE